MESVFVTLAIHDAPTCLKRQLFLNLQEMWMSLVFQTLTSLSLDEYLPKDVNTFWSGNHLNVALPLWQGFTGNETQDAMKDATGGRASFQQYLMSDDPTIRQWAENARDSFNDIRNSPDPVLRGYYQDLQLKRRLKAQKTWESKKLGNLEQYLSEAEATVQVSHNDELTEIICGVFRFTISRSLQLNLGKGDRILLQFHLTETRHPNAYAWRAQPRDPASRLAVSIRSHSNDSRVTWLSTKGHRAVNKMNSLVDILEGYTLEESRSFDRRWHVKRMVPGYRSSRINMYT